MKISLNKLLFYIAFIPWIMSWMLTSSYLKDYIHPYMIIRIWTNLGIVLLSLKAMLKTKVNSLRVFGVLFVLFFGFFVSLGNGNASFVFYTLFLILSASDIDFKEIVKITMYSQVFTMFLTVVAAIVGIVPNDVTESIAGGFLRTRHSLGYLFYTFVPNFYLSIILELLYLKKGRFNLFTFSILSMINLVIYRYTETRTAFILVTLCLLSTLIFQFFNLNKVMNSFIRYSYPVFASLSVLMSYFYNPENKLFFWLNTLLTQRLRFAKQGINTWGISIFGSSVTWDSSAVNYNYIDSSYINILVCYGIVIFILTVVGFYLSMKKIIIIRDYVLLFVLFIWATRAFIDPQLFLIWFNPFLFLIWSANVPRERI